MDTFESCLEFIRDQERKKNPLQVFYPDPMNEYDCAQCGKSRAKHRILFCHTKRTRKQIFLDAIEMYSNLKIMVYSHIMDRKLTIGRTVIYRLNNGERITQNGQSKLPATVVAVWSDQVANIKVHGDSPSDIWKTSCHHGKGENCWHWPDEVFDIESGDIVFLKGNHPTLMAKTVKSVKNGKAICTWFEGAHVQEQEYSVEELYH